MPRNSSFDVLRIIATFQATFYHMFHLNFDFKERYQLPFLTEILYSLTTTCDIHFSLISSYFGVNSKFSIVKYFPIIMSTFFYSLLGYFSALFFTNTKKFDHEEFLKYLFPLAYKQYWYTYPFICSQILLALIYPTLTKMEKKAHLFFAISILFMFLMPHIRLYRNDTFSPYSSAVFLTYSFFGSYFSIHKINISRIKILLFFIIMFIYNYMINFTKIPYDFWIFKVLQDRHLFYFPQFMFGLSTFLLFSSFELHTKYFQIFQQFAEFSLDIYMCHYNHAQFPLWENLLLPYKNDLTQFWKYVLLFGGKIYIVCALIDFVKKRIFNILIFQRNYYYIFNQYIKEICV